MKFLSLALVALFSFSAFSKDIVCTGEVDGRDVEWKVSVGEGNLVQSLSLKVDGEKMAAFQTENLSVTEHVYGTLIASSTREISGIMLLLGNGKSQDTGYIYLYDKMTDPNVGSPVNCK